SAARARVNKTFLILPPYSALRVTGAGPRPRSACDAWQAASPVSGKDMGSKAPGRTPGWAIYKYPLGSESTTRMGSGQTHARRAGGTDRAVARSLEAGPGHRPVA